MLVVLAPEASAADAERIAGIARDRQLYACVVGKPGSLAVAISGGAERPARALFEREAHVARIDETPSSAFLATRAFQREDTLVDVGGIEVGGRQVVLMAGPCAVESEDQIFAVAETVKKQRIPILRAGAYKPRTSPWTFQGLEQHGLELLDRVKAATGLRIVSEVVSDATVGPVAEVADLVQVGARNMKNYELLKRVGRCGRPVLLKRGADATLAELLASAEYLLAGGCPGVILCERGVRGFGDHARNTLDLAAVPALERMTHLPVLVDPSHGTGARDLVTPLARAAVAAGADGLLVEVHPRPEVALSDGAQALRPEDLERLVREVAAVAAAIGRSA